MAVTLSISQQEMNSFKKNLRKFKSKSNVLIRSRMARAGKEMESVSKMTVTSAGLVDTGRLRSSLVAHPIDKGYGQEIMVDLTKVESPAKGRKSNAAKGVVALVNYAKYHEPRVKFLEKGQKAGMKKFKQLMSR